MEREMKREVLKIDIIMVPCMLCLVHSAYGTRIEIRIIFVWNIAQTYVIMGCITIFWPLCRCQPTSFRVADQLNKWVTQHKGNQETLEMKQYNFTSSILKGRPLESNRQEATVSSESASISTPPHKWSPLMRRTLVNSKNSLTSVGSPFFCDKSGMVAPWPWIKNFIFHLYT